MTYSHEFTARPRTHMLECMLDAYLTEWEAAIDLRGTDVVASCVDGLWSVYFDDAGIDRMSAMLAELMLERDKLHAFCLAARQAAAAYQAVSVVADPDSVVDRAEDLYARLSEIFVGFTGIQAFYQASDSSFVSGAIARLDDVLDGAGGSDLSRLAGALAGPSRLTLRTFQEERDWLRLAEAGNTGELDEDTLRIAVQAHADKYGFLLLSSPGGDAVAWLMQRLATERHRKPHDIASRLSKLDRRSARALEERKAVIESVPAGISAAAEAVAELGVERLRLREDFTAAAYSSHPLFQAAYRRADVTDDYGRVLSRQELLEAVDGEHPDRAAVDVRVKRSVFFISGDRKQFFCAGEEAALLASLSAAQNTDGVRGLVVHGSGRVRGRAFTIDPRLSTASQIESIRRLPPGSIVIVGMTNPAVVPWCQGAAGIVTDYGGITCHAAIIARELAIPCVVGTGNATTTISTGDQVEMDLVAGTVQTVAAPLNDPSGRK